MTSKSSKGLEISEILDKIMEEDPKTEKKTKKEATNPAARVYDYHHKMQHNFITSAQDFIPRNVVTDRISTYHQADVIQNNNPGFYLGLGSPVTPNVCPPILGRERCPTPYSDLTGCNTGMRPMHPEFNGYRPAYCATTGVNLNSPVQNENSYPPVQSYKNSTINRLGTFSGHIPPSQEMTPVMYRGPTPVPTPVPHPVTAPLHIPAYKAYEYSQSNASSSNASLNNKSTYLESSVKSFTFSSLPPPPSPPKLKEAEKGKGPLSCAPNKLQSHTPPLQNFSNIPPLKQTSTSPKKLHPCTPMHEEHSSLFLYKRSCTPPRKPQVSMHTSLKKQHPRTRQAIQDSCTQTKFYSDSQYSKQDTQPHKKRHIEVSLEKGSKITSKEMNAKIYSNMQKNSFAAPPLPPSPAPENPPPPASPPPSSPSSKLYEKKKSKISMYKSSPERSWRENSKSSLQNDVTGLRKPKEYQEIEMSKYKKYKKELDAESYRNYLKTIKMPEIVIPIEKEITGSEKKLKKVMDIKESKRHKHKSLNIKYNKIKENKSITVPVENNSNPESYSQKPDFGAGRSFINLNNQGNFNPADGLPPFNPVGGGLSFNPGDVPPPFNPVGGGPSFNPMSRAPPFNPMFGDKPFTPSDGSNQEPFNPPFNPPGPMPPHFNHRGRGSHFQSMRRRGRPFNSRGRGQPPFRNPMGGGPPFSPGCSGPNNFSLKGKGCYFNPMNDRFPFIPMGAGGPQFNSREGRPQAHFKSMGGEPFPPPPHPMGAGPSTFSSLTEPSFDRKDEVVYQKGYEEEDYNEEPSYDKHSESDYEYTQNIKHTKETKRIKKTKYIKDQKYEDDTEYLTDIKLTKNVKHTKEIKHTKEVKWLKKDSKSKSKKSKLMDYELEPGEYVSDVEMGKEPSSSSLRGIISSSEESEDEKNSIKVDPLPKFLQPKKQWPSYASTTSSSSGDSTSSEDEDNFSSKTLEKPKYPRYFKDKVAFTDEVLVPLDDVTEKSNEKELLVDKKKVFIGDDTAITKRPLSPPIESESLKAAKTPLIKRLGLIKEEEKEANDSEIEINQTQFEENSMKTKNIIGSIDQKDDLKKKYSQQLITSCYAVKEKEIRSPASVRSDSMVDFFDKSRSNSLSPNNSLDFEEYRLLASTQEILSASKSIFKSPTSPKITTTKKNYEKPIIKVETVQKPNPVKESPQRIDLDSRIKIMFGMKSSEEDSPEKRSFRSSSFNHKNMRLLPRPPSPFRSKNSYQFWHRETYYYRKNNPVPDEFCDPTLRRKIGIQIKKLEEYESDQIAKGELDRNKLPEGIFKIDGTSSKSDLKYGEISETGSFNVDKPFDQADQKSAILVKEAKKNISENNREMTLENYKAENYSELSELTKGEMKISELNIDKMIKDKLKTNKAGDTASSIINETTNVIIFDPSENNLKVSTVKDETHDLNFELTKVSHIAKESFKPLGDHEDKMDTFPDVTRVNVFPDSEIELVSDSPMKNTNLEKESETVVELVLSKILEELKNALRNSVTESIINQQLNE